MFRVTTVNYMVPLIVLVNFDNTFLDQIIQFLLLSCANRRIKIDRDWVSRFGKGLLELDCVDGFLFVWVNTNNGRKWNHPYTGAVRKHNHGNLWMGKRGPAVWFRSTCDNIDIHPQRLDLHMRQVKPLKGNCVKSRLVWSCWPKAQAIYLSSYHPSTTL